VDELEKIAAIVGKYGFAPLLGCALLVLVVRITKPEIFCPAVARVYADLCRAVGVWWESHREYVAAKRDRDRALEASARSLEVAWSIADPRGSRSIDRLVYGAPPDGGDPRTTGQRQALEASPGIVGQGGGGVPGAPPGGDPGAGSHTETTTK